MLLTDRILFLDGEAIVIDKPAGLPVDQPRDGSLAVANQLDLLRFGFQRQPQAVHRLDRDTSGCLLLARNPKAHARFSRTWEEGAVSKTYIAVLAGEIAEDEGQVELPLLKRSTEETGWRMVGSPQGKRAVTDWVVLARKDGRTLVRFRPLTGRTHQIRVHAVEGLGVPIAGDPVYGDGRGPMLLHAAALSVPRAGKRAVDASCPLPERFGAFVGLAGALA